MKPKDVCPVRSEREGHDVGHHFICAWYGQEYWGKCKYCHEWRQYDESLGLRNKKKLAPEEASRRSKEKGKRRVL